MATTLVGDRVRFDFQFFALGTTDLVDHTDVAVIHRTPHGVETVYTLVDDPTVVFRESEGTYYAEILVEEYRRHYFRAYGRTSPNEKSIEEYIDVPESAFDEPIPE